MTLLLHSTDVCDDVVLLCSFPTPPKMRFVEVDFPFTDLAGLR